MTRGLEEAWVAAACAGIYAVGDPAGGALVYMGAAEAVAAADVLPPGRLIVFSPSLASDY